MISNSNGFLNNGDARYRSVDHESELNSNGFLRYPSIHAEFHRIPTLPAGSAAHAPHRPESAEICLIYVDPRLYFSLLYKHLPAIYAYLI